MNAPCITIAEKRAIIRAYDTGVNVADVAPAGSDLYGWPEREHAQVTVARPGVAAVSIPAATLEEWCVELAPTPMPLDAILPLIREVGHLREHGHYHEAAELEERIRRPITVADRTLEFTGDENGWRWRTQGLGDTNMQMSVHGGRWGALLVTYADNLGISITAQGGGPTIAAALSDAHARYQAAVADTLLRMGGLLREVGQ